MAWGGNTSSVTQVSGKSGCPPGFEGRCYDMLGREVGCADIRNGTAASAMYIMGDNGCNKSILVAGQFIEGCPGTQEFWNRTVISAERQSIQKMLKWLIAMAIILLMII